MEPLECDYLVIGAGAMGMAFTDELLARTRDDEVLIVDRKGQPGGHWNDAYPYVRLHQPSHFYGVNSRKLERSPPRLDGENELATGAEVLAYFAAVLDGWKESGRVQFMPMCEVDEGGHRIASLVEPGRCWEVRVRKKVVDSGYMKVEVPSRTPPKYTVAPGALLVPPNSLPFLAEPRERYVVIGAGKTGMDAVIWLLRRGVSPERVHWVMPRDPWMINRRYVQPGGVTPLKYPHILRTLGGTQARLTKSKAEKLSDEETLRKEALVREKVGMILRVDEDVMPEAFQCATVNEEEIELMRKVKPNIIRMGHVQEVGVERLLLEGGEVPTGEGTLHVDCTADGLSRRPAVPIWAGERITLQSVRTCQQVGSAAMIAFVESRSEGDGEKNAILVPVPHPNDFKDWIVCEVMTGRNQLAFGKSGGIRWSVFSRLSMDAHMGIATPRILMGHLASKVTRLFQPESKL